MFFNVNGKLIEKNAIFADLSPDNINTAEVYFKNHLDQNKFSRTKSNLAYSFINTNKGIFVISRETIGIGASGRVKIAKSIANEIVVAVKIQDFYMSSIKHYEELVNEGLVLNKLNQLHSSAIIWHTIYKNNEYHPDIKNNCGQKLNNLKYYIFIELVEGTTLSDYFTNIRIHNEFIATQKFLAIIVKILHKLQDLHNKNVVHGDLSFNNILILDHGNGKFDINLIDFGMARILNNDEIAKCRTICSMHDIKKNYLPPEYDVGMVNKEIIPQLLENNNAMTKKQLELIIHFARLQHGFVHKNTDLYVLCWNINYFMVLTEESQLGRIVKHHLHTNAFLRGNVDLLLEKLTKIMDFFNNKAITNNKETTLGKEKNTEIDLVNNPSLLNTKNEKITFMYNLSLQQRKDPIKAHKVHDEHHNYDQDIQDTQDREHNFKVNLNNYFPTYSLF